MAEKRKRALFIVAVDLPSGMDADSGAADPACPNADLTVTLAFPKPGMFAFPGAEKTGKLVISDIGIPAWMGDDINIELMTPAWAVKKLPARTLNTNKGSFGRVMVAAGSINFIGAAYLACSGALRVGAGLVTLATAGSLQNAIASKLAEVTYLPLPEEKPGIIAAEAAEVLRNEMGQYKVLLLGCGLGRHPATAAFLDSLISEAHIPSFIIDADGLNIISILSDWPRKVQEGAVLTPHPGEMSRLCGLSVEQIQADRPGVARKYAEEWHKIVVLKGAFTVIADPDGRCRISPFANPVLATAGTGDVLAGVIAGMAAQGLDSFDAASLGVFLHGEAGEQVKAGLGDTGMIASDLLPALPLTIKKLKNTARTGG